jgi:hypothetical protein
MKGAGRDYNTMEENIHHNQSIYLYPENYI